MSKFKFITSGQSPDNAPVITQVLRGRSLLPLAPVNVRGARNSNGDLAIGVTRRSRLGAGLRPFADVPLGEEQALYEIEVYSGSTLKRTWRFGLTQQMPVMWSQFTNYDGPFGSPTITERVNGGVGYSDSDPGANSRSFGLSKTLIFGDVQLEFAADPTSPLIENAPSTLGICPLAVATLADMQASDRVFWTQLGGDYATDGGAGQSYTEGDRFMIEIEGGVVRYYKNYTGATSVPVYSSTLILDSPPYQVFCDFSSALSGYTGQGFISAFLRQLSAQTMYTKEQQVADFGSAQSAIKVRVYQVSAIVGRGAYIEATI